MQLHIRCVAVCAGIEIHAASHTGEVAPDAFDAIGGIACRLYHEGQFAHLLLHYGSQVIVGVGLYYHPLHTGE